MVMGAVAFSYAYFTKQYVPLQVVSSFFFVEFLIRVTLGLRYSPVGAVARVISVGPPAWVPVKPKRFAWTLGLGMAFAMTVITNSGIRGLPAPDDVPDLPDADVDGVGSWPMPGLPDPWPPGPTWVDREERPECAVRRWRLRAADVDCDGVGVPMMPFSAGLGAAARGGRSRGPPRGADGRPGIRVVLLAPTDRDRVCVDRSGAYRSRARQSVGQREPLHAGVAKLLHSSWYQ